MQPLEWSIDASYVAQGENTRGDAWIYSIRRAARATGISSSHLQRRFSAVIGHSPLQYAHAWKLDRIAERLRAGSTLPLVDLAAEFGFGDQKHFRTLFQRRFGLSPSAYRRNPPPSDPQTG